MDTCFLRLAGVGILIAAIACGQEGQRSEDRGDRYSAAGELLDARVEYELALERAGEDAPFQLRLKAAELALASKDFEVAAGGFTALVSEQPEFAERASALYLLHADRWLAAGDTFAALRAVDWLRAQDTTANLGRLHYVLGDVAYARPDYAAAAVAYRLGLANDSTAATSRVYARLGEASSRTRNCVAAVAYLQTYLEITENSGDEAEASRHALGTCALRLAQRAYSRQDYERAMSYVQMMVRVGEPASRMLEADLLTGKLHERFGNREAAMRYYQRVLNADEQIRSRPAVEAFRRLKQLEFGMPLRSDASGPEESGPGSEEAGP